MDAPLPASAAIARTLEPDPRTHPRRRVATMALSLYASWWLQLTSGYFRWIFALSHAEIEGKQAAIDKVHGSADAGGGGGAAVPGARQRRGGSAPATDAEPGGALDSRAPNPFTGGGHGVKRPRTSDAVKEHARFFLLLDWSGALVGHVVRTAMSKQLADYGLRHEMHAFVSQHVGELCGLLDAHFRAHRYLLATPAPTLADVMMGAAFAFMLKDDPPRSDILSGVFPYLERFIADVTLNRERFAELDAQLGGGGDGGDGNGDGSGVAAPTDASDGSAAAASTAPGAASLREAMHSKRAARRQVVAAARRASLFGFDAVTGKDEMIVSATPRHVRDAAARTAAAAGSKLPPDGESEGDRGHAGGSSVVGGAVRAVPTRQVTSDADVVPETLAPIFALMEEVFPWLHAQRDSVEDRINTALSAGLPLEVVTLPDVPSLGEFAGARVPAIGRLPRLVAKAWEMEVENPRGTGIAPAIEGRTADARTGGGRAAASATSVVECGTSMPHVYQTQFVAREAAAVSFDHVPAPSTAASASGGVVPISDELLSRLRDQLVALSLEAPWDVAPQFMDRADAEYVVFRRHALSEADRVEVIDERRAARKRNRTKPQ
jgi:hypothetical protein